METNLEKLEKAHKRVRKIKGFYSHLIVYLVVNIILLLIKNDVSNYIIQESGIHDEGFARYLHWQFISTPIWWGFILVIQALNLFGHPIIAGWEKRKINEIMNKEEQNSK